MIRSFHVVQIFPSPYRVHMFTEMYKQFSELGISFHVHLMSNKKGAQRPDSWQSPEMHFPYTYWRDFGYKSYAFNPGLLLHLRKSRPDGLLIGDPFDTFTSIFAAWLCPAKIRCAWTEGNTKTPGEMKGGRGFIKRLVFSKYPLIACPGHDAAEYVKMHQALTKRIMPKAIFLPNLIDETRFKVRNEWGCEDIAIGKKILNINDDSKVCIIPARLLPVKGLLEFISLLDADMLSSWKVRILGKGPLKESIRFAICSKGLCDKIDIIEDVDYGDMPKCYAASNLFLLPSVYDPNPLCVPEALHSGLPIALSDQAGNVEEGVVDGVNGWRLPVKNVLKMKLVLQEIFDAPKDKLSEMGIISKSCNAKFWDTKRAIAEFIKGILDNV